MTDVMVPALGESVSEATVSTWFKKPGDFVKQDEMLCELETDKVSVEVPAPVSGILTEIIAAEGATVAANARLAIMTEGAQGAAPTAQKPATAQPEVQAAAQLGSPAAGPEQPVARRDVEHAHRSGRRYAEHVGDALFGRGRAPLLDQPALVPDREAHLGPGQGVVHVLEPVEVEVDDREAVTVPPRRRHRRGRTRAVCRATCGAAPQLGGDRGHVDGAQRLDQCGPRSLSIQP